MTSTYRIYIIAMLILTLDETDIVENAARDLLDIPENTSFIGLTKYIRTVYKISYADDNAFKIAKYVSEL